MDAGLTDNRRLRGSGIDEVHYRLSGSGIDEPHYRLSESRIDEENIDSAET